MKWITHLRFSLTDTIIYVVIAAYFFIFTYLSIIDHLSLHSNMNDLGGIDQAVHQTLQGNFMRNSSFFVAEGVTNPSILSKHSHYSLILLLPLYALYQNPVIFLVIQTLLVSLGALPLYWLGKKLFTNNTYLPLVVPIVYIVNPMIHDGLLYDFNPIIAISSIILFAFYALYTDKKVWFYLLAILIALTKEDAPLIVAMFGVYMIISQKKNFEGALLTIVSVVFFYINLKYLMPYFSGTEVNPLIQARFAHVGGSVDEGVRTLLTKPWTLIANIFTPIKIGYLVLLLLPFAFLPLVSPLVSLLALPNLGINLTSSVLPMHYPFEYYYQVPIVTVFCLATLFSLKMISDSKPLYLKPLTILVVGLSVLTSLTVSPAPYSRTSSVNEFRVSEHARNITKIKTLVPSDASLSIQNNLGPHFSNRMTLYTYPYFADRADYVILDTTDPNPIYNTFRTTRTFMFNTQMTPQEYYDSILSISENQNYAPIYFEDGYLIFEKNAQTLIAQDEFIEELNTRIKNLYAKYNLEVKTIDSL